MDVVYNQRVIFDDCWEM